MTSGRLSTRLLSGTLLIVPGWVFKASPRAVFTYGHRIVRRAPAPGQRIYRHRFRKGPFRAAAEIFYRFPLILRLHAATDRVSVIAGRPYWRQSAALLQKNVKRLLAYSRSPHGLSVGLSHRGRGISSVAVVESVSFYLWAYSLPRSELSGVVVGAVDTANGSDDMG